jgi:4-hydroxy-tetrahydrodipicolinate reductase
MNILVLGRGKTGSLVADAARERKHGVRVMGSAENPYASALSADTLRNIAVIIDFTNSAVVTKNIEACVRAGKDMVVGTTGWHDQLPAVRKMVEDAGTGFLHGSNFSIGVNLFFETARTVSNAMDHGYLGQIFERHHAHKKDAPSGTALTVQKVIRETSGAELEIVSFREGDVVGMHEVVLDSPNDTIYLCHDAKSRRGFAEGAVRAAEWLAGRKGFFDFKDIWREL